MMTAMMTKHLLALDVATVVGCCDGAIGGEPRLWSWFLDDAGPLRGARLHALAGFLDRYFAQQPCDGVVYEAPLGLGAMHRIGAQEATVALLRGAVGVVEERCYAHNKPVADLPAQAARESVLGWRTHRKGQGVVVKRRKPVAGKPDVRDETVKERIMREVALYAVAPMNDNEADAFVLWRFACNKENPRLALASTPLFREEESHG